MDGRGHRRRGAAGRVDGEVGAERRAIGGTLARGAPHFCLTMSNSPPGQPRRRAAPSIRGPSYSAHSNSTFRSRGAFAPGSLQISDARPPNRGRAERRDGAGCVARQAARERADAKHPWRAVRLARRDACEASRVPLRSGTRASRRSTVAIFGRGPRFRLRDYPPEAVQRCSSQPGHGARRAVPRASRVRRLRAGRRGTPLPAPPSARLRRRPSMSRDANHFTIVGI